MSKQCSLGSGEVYIDKIQKAIILTILTAVISDVELPSEQAKSSDLLESSGFSRYCACAL